MTMVDKYEDIIGQLKAAETIEQGIDACYEFFTTLPDSTGDEFMAFMCGVTWRNGLEESPSVFEMVDSFINIHLAGKLYGQMHKGA
tara:strand:- start:2744 stop:3001 length:258 start_codon:yes stop_codon:yes gene_type:complete